MMNLNAVSFFVVMTGGICLVWDIVDSAKKKDFFGFMFSVLVFFFWFMCCFIIDWELLTPKIIKLLGETTYE